MTIDQYRSAFSSAMRSYNAMETTKRRHFDFLTLLDAKKKKFNLQATPQEASKLEQLLKDHHEEVQAFKLRCESLKLEDPQAHRAMFEYIAELNGATLSRSNSVNH